MPRATVVDASLAIDRSLYAAQGQEVPRRACDRRRGVHLVNTMTGLVIRPRCKRRACPYCLPIDATNYGRAIAMSRPERFILLTKVGDDWPTIKKKINLLNEKVRRRGLRHEYAYQVEPNPSSGGCHVHMWQHGDLIEQALLSELADRVGMGVVVNVIDVSVEPVVGTYGLNEVFVEGVDEELSGRARRFLELNGNRLGHSSRAFWRDRHGAAVTGSAEAIRAALSRSTDRGQWMIIGSPDYVAKKNPA